MTQRITARVEGQRVALDFEGFDGDDCVAERERVRRELARLGIRSELRDRQAKAPVAYEVGTPDEGRTELT